MSRIVLTKLEGGNHYELELRCRSYELFLPRDSRGSVCLVMCVPRHDPQGISCQETIGHFKKL